MSVSGDQLSITCVGCEAGANGLVCPVLASAEADLSEVQRRQMQTSQERAVQLIADSLSAAAAGVPPRALLIDRAGTLAITKAVRQGECDGPVAVRRWALNLSWIGVRVSFGPREVQCHNGAITPEVRATKTRHPSLYT